MRKLHCTAGLVWGVLALAAGMILAGGNAWAQDAQAAGAPQNGAQGGGRRGGRGFGMGPGGGRGVIGTVTAVAGDHYTIQGEDGVAYTVHFSVNTHIVKSAGGPRQRGEGQEGGQRQPPTPLKATDIKVGDVISAGGELDEAAKSIGAVFIAQIDPERVKEMRAMEANYGKTWLAGRVTGVEGTTITIEGAMDHARHAIEVDENTSFRKRRESITLADIQPGMQLRAEGALQGGGFRATQVTAVDPRREGGPGQGHGPEQGAGAQPPGA
ncbi:MAG TPA: DUF5666 domain-containing protein [Acidobacteriaceae bacterium]|nr:DUF5666 domain-containing protein [Acidobacteriaceae bacterium]